MNCILGLYTILLLNSLFLVAFCRDSVLDKPARINRSHKNEDRNDFKRQIGRVGEKKDETKTRNVRAANNQNTDTVTIEVQRLFDSLNHKRSVISEPRKDDDNGNEITIVIENDGNDDYDDDDDDGELREPRDNIEKTTDQSGFSIILDRTKDGMKENSNDFAALSRSYDKMSNRFEKYLSDEKQHLPTIAAKVTKANRRTEIERKEVESKEEKLKPNSIISEDDHINSGNENQRSNIINNNQHNDKINSNVIRDENQLPFSNPSPRSHLFRTPTKKLKNRVSSTLKLLAINSTSKRMDKSERPIRYDQSTRRLEKGRDERGRDERGRGEAGRDDKGRDVRGRDYEGKSGTRLNIKHRYEDDNKDDNNVKHYRENDKEIRYPNQNETKVHNYPTENARTALRNVTQYKDEKIIKTDVGMKKEVNNETTSNKSSININNNGERIVHPRKAQAMLEYLNKDPLESWIFKFSSLKELGLNSAMLRNGLVNAGSIDRLKNVMKRALQGEDITLSVLGGSISAGGGLYKDEESIAGLYYKGLVDWWNKAITPLTGSEMKVNNIAIGSIGSDYFSYCLKSHVTNETDIILWELSGNDYNRYLKLPTKGARPLERLTRMALMLPREPALIYVNFFKGVDYKKSKKSCPNFEDQGEDIVAHYYKIPSLSWRAMVCQPLVDNEELFTLKTLFCKDQYHPSLRGHAQTALLLILHIRHVMRSVLQAASTNDGYLPNFLEYYNIPPPLFLGLEYPTPLCWTLITPDFKESIYDSLDVKILVNNGFKLEYATNFPIRFDRVICWKAEKADAMMKAQFYVPDNLNRKTAIVDDQVIRKTEIAITTHTRFGGSAKIWIDQEPDNPLIIKEGRAADTGKRTQVDMISKTLEPGVHTLNLKALDEGFCLTSIMVD